MNENYQARIDRTRQAIKQAECLLIGGGAGLSAAAGLTYSGARFTDNFADYIDRYGMTDMYSSGFYPFESQEEKWAYWSRHVLLNRYAVGALPLYTELFGLAKDKDYFVITTNVDFQFYKAEFDPKRIFATQGDYGKFQCGKGCHNKLYDNEAQIKQMSAEQKDCAVPSRLVPKCPVCGADMDLNIRKDMYFVEDENWHKAYAAWENYLAGIGDRKIALLELGIGYNTPSIIKFPFEQITAQKDNVSLIRINKDYPETSEINKEKTIVFDENLEDIIVAMQ